MGILGIVRRTRYDYDTRVVSAAPGGLLNAINREITRMQSTGWEYLGRTHAPSSDGVTEADALKFRRPGAQPCRRKVMPLSADS